MGQGVAVLIVFACNTLNVVFACLNGTLLGSLILVSEHVRLQVLDMSAASCDRAETLVRVVG